MSAFANRTSSEPRHRGLRARIRFRLSQLTAAGARVDRGEVHDLAARLSTYSHHRLKGRAEYRLRIGDYRIIYEFDQSKNILHLLAVGHRREVYR